MRLLLATFLFAIASALVPVLNLEAYLAVVAAQATNFSLALVALVGGAGQMVGKVVWFYGGRRSLEFEWLRKRMMRPRWRASYDKWHERIHGRPVFAGGISFVSALTGLPPFAVISVLAGSLGMNFLVFMVTGFVGRALRFYLVLAGVWFAFGH